MELHRCMVCGFKGIEWAPDSVELYASSDICSACGTEFGFDIECGIPADERNQQIEARRAEWIANGHKWWFTEEPEPPDWDWKENLAAIRVEAD